MNSLRGLVLHGYEKRRHGQSVEAQMLFRQAAEVAAATGDRSVHVDALRGWANSEGDLGRLQAAAEKYDEAIAMLRGMNDPQRLAHTLRHRADVARHMGDRASAEQGYGEALKIYRAHEATDRLDLGNALRGCALLAEDAGDRIAARTIWCEALILYEAVGVEAGVAEARAHADRPD